MKLITDIFSRIEELRKIGYRVNIESYIRRGVEIFRKAPELFLIYTVLYLVAMPIGGFLLTAPLSAGYFIVARRLDKGKTIVFDHFFDGFKMFMPLFLLTIISAIVIFIGFIALIIPGIYLSVAYTFAIFFIIFEKLDFWEAMEASRKIVAREWFSVFVLVIALGLLNFLGLMAFGIGLLFTVPISYAALYVAFDDIWEKH